MRKIVGWMLPGLLMAALILPASGANGQTVPPSGQPQVLELKAGRFDLAGSAALDHARPLKAGESGLYVVQFRGPITADAWKAMALAGAQVDTYLPDFAFLVRMTPADARALAQEGSVKAVVRYQPAWKLNPGQALSGDATLRIHAFPGREQAVARQLQTLGAAGVQAASASHTVVARVSRRTISQLIQSEDVTFVDEVRPNRLMNDVAAGLINVSPPGGPWSLGLTGANQVVGIADTGLDTGNLATLNPDLANRLQVTPIALGRPNDWSDPYGHGTHTAGSIAGDGTLIPTLKGMAPDSKLVFQSVLDSSGGLGGLPSDLNTLFGQAAGYGATIHSNSWGVPYDSGGWTYDAEAQQVDQYTWNNKNFTIVFAAGNSGQNARGTTQYNSVTTPGTAKNAITVGASENNRPSLGSYADNPNTIAVFSSRGNTPDGRLKPDVVAPGTWILSTRSTIAPDYNYWGNYDTYHAYDSGTSMATPITAGSAALVRQYYTDRQGITPAASLIKATLINGAQNLGYGWMSLDQGWGRIDLTGSLAPQNGRANWYENEANSLATNDSRAYNFSVAAGGPLKVTLVWTDYPGAVQAGRELVNDLDLTVSGPDGTTYKGNCFVGGAASTACVAYDRTNNVENVYLNAPAAGVYTVRVNAFNVPNGPQPYSLVVSGQGVAPAAPDTTPPTVAITQPADGATVTGAVAIAANAADDVAVTLVEYYVDGALKGSNTTSPYSYTWDSTTVANGSHTLTAKAYDAAGNNASASVTVNVANVNTTATVTDTFTGALNYAGASATDYIDVSAPGTISLNLRWPTTSANLDMVLYNPSGVQVAAAQTTANPETISYNATTTGRYRIRVASVSGGSSFLLTADHPVNNTVTAALTQTGTLAQNTYQQFAITVGAAGTVDMAVSFPSGTDFDLYLLNSSGTTVASATSATLNPETISYQVSGPGTYTVKVKAYSGSGSFTLTGHYPR